MSAKKLILTGISIFCFGASLFAQESRGKHEYKDGLDEEDHAAVIVKTKDMCLYSRNLISLMPFQFTENGVGVGLSWEYTLDHDGYLALYLPVIATFNLNKSANYPSNVSHNDMMFYAMPGIKFYPTGLGKVKYAIGPSAVIAAGEQAVGYDHYYYPYYSSTYPYDPYTNQSHFLFGMLINNSLNINPTPRLHVGLELGLGFTYIDRVGDINQGVKTLVQGNFNIGFRL